MAFPPAEALTGQGLRQTLVELLLGESATGFEQGLEVAEYPGVTAATTLGLERPADNRC